MNAPTANLPAVKAPLEAGASVAAIIPRTIEETFRLAQALAGSGLAPSSLNTPDKVMVAVMAGAELGLPPFQAMQSFAVINGRPAIWGDGLMAVVRSNGFRVREWFDGDGDALTARCEVTRPDTGETVPGEFSVADAKRAGLWDKAGPWKQYPKRMLKMRARAFALRDGAADVLRGFQIREEVEDYVEVREVQTRPGTGLRARLEAREASTTDQQGFDASHVAAATGGQSQPLDEILDGDFIPTHDEQASEAAPAPEGEEGAAVPVEPPPQTSIPEGMARGSDIQAPAYLYEDAAEFASVAPGHLEAVKTLADLTALWTEWQAELKRLQKSDLPAYQDVCKIKNARKAELEADEARG